MKKKISIDEKVLDAKIAMYNKYIVFWENFFKSRTNNKDYIIINYKELVNNSKNILKQILIFFNYKINDEYINRCSEIHSKDGTLQNLKDVKIYNKIRFTDAEAKENHKKLILPILEKKIQNTKILQTYNNLFSKNL